MVTIVVTKARKRTTITFQVKKWCSMFQLPSQKILIYPFNWLKTFQFSYFNLFISMLAYAFSSPVNKKNISTWKLKIILSNWKVLLVTPMVEKFEKVYHNLISSTNFKWNPQIRTDDDDDLENRVSLCGRFKGQNLCVLYY